MESPNKTEESDIEHINKTVVDNEEKIEQKTVKEARQELKEVRQEQKTRPHEQKTAVKQHPKLQAKKAMHNKHKPTIIRKKYVVKKTTEKKKSTKLTWLWILIAIIVIAAVAFLVIRLGYQKTVEPIKSEVAATVNGEAIYSKDIDDQYNSLSPVLQQTYTKEALLNQTIDELLLIQEAKSRNIKAESKDINDELDNFKKLQGLSEEDFTNLLAKQNLTIDKVKALIERRIMIKNLLNQTIFANTNISNQAVNEYYLQNQEKFKEPATVTVQHILIMINANVTEAKALERIKEVEKQLTSTNFCELAKNYSEDPGSKDTCGTYTFGAGEMVPEFEEASFDLEINKTEIVKTAYGYHLIKKLDFTDEKTIELSEVETDIRNFLHDQKAQQNFDVMIQELRAKATIVNYMYKTDPINSTITTNLDSFAKCLTEKGVKMYGAYWCPHCENNKKLFGDSWKYMNYVECAVEGQPQVQTQACTDAGISGYPTWLINNEKYPGEQTLEKLSSLTGCKI